MHTVELHNFHASQNIIGMINTRRERWAEDIANKNNNNRNAYKILIEKPEGK
jgi:hypothetical protein